MYKTELPMKGLKVIELATVVAAPITGRILAEFGAEVIKIESPPYGDSARTIGLSHSLPIDEGNNPLFDQLNTGKRFVALNLKTEEGMEAFLKLLEDADVFITNVRMKSLVKMGINYDSIKDRFPELIYAHFSGLGIDGDEANKPCFDQTAFWTRSGALTEVLARGSVPPSMSFGFGDIVSSSSFLNGILMAIYARNNSGEGTFISTSLLKTAIWCSSTAALNSQPQYGVEYPINRLKPWNPFAEFYRCADGEWIGVFDREYDKNRHFHARVFNMPELVEDPDLETLPKMRASDKIEAVTRKVELAFRERTSAEWKEIFDARDIANEVNGHFKDLHTDPQAVANEWFHEVEYEEGVTTYMPSAPIDYSDYGHRRVSKTGALGCDTDAVLAELGYSEEAIKAMRDSKAVM
ncbi:MAG: CaiB/BaiF CoA-transferase family protein [Firmicutes bacterium]|nr:CaiB/BaiF CoA-transferase family protein [Bacillota bacterium]